jgi:hypothetical protein
VFAEIFMECVSFYLAGFRDSDIFSMVSRVNLYHLLSAGILHPLVEAIIAAFYLLVNKLFRGLKLNRKSITVEKSPLLPVISSLGKARDTWLASRVSFCPSVMALSGGYSK